MLFRIFLVFIFLFVCSTGYSQQQSVQFSTANQFFTGVKILKVKRDFNDPYLWVLAQNDQVYRINSLTQTVDNYTATFAAYNNFHFIDIVGRSKDTVFIATSSPNIIQYKNGNSKLVGGTNGIPNTVTSLGIDYTDKTAQDLGITPPNNHMLDIGTVKGLYNYDIDAETLTLSFYNTDYSQVFEASYRSFIYSGEPVYFIMQDTITDYPINYNNGITSYLSYARVSANLYGTKVNTSYYVVGAGYMSPYDADGTDNYWGTDKGMFQISSDLSYFATTPFNQYLAGITVNKITSILGLTTFGNANGGITSDNLLIGTNSGFYYSSNRYDYDTTANGADKLTILHYAGLANTPVNDICVNTTSIITPICEDGVWVATDSGLYYLTPDYTDYINSKNTTAISFQNQPDSISQKNLCAGDSVNTVVNYGGNTIQWYKNGSPLDGQTNDTLAVKTTGDYYANLYDPCRGFHLSSNHLKVNVITNPVFTFNYPDTIQQCINTPDTLKTTNTPGYHYQWYTNDVLNGDTASSFAVIQPGKYKVEVSACLNNWMPSKEVQVNLIQLPIPAIIADKMVYCIGDDATLSTAVPPNPSYTINWYKDNVLLPNNTNQDSITTNIAGNYTVSIINNAANTDGSTCSQTSAIQSVSFNPRPTVSIEKIVTATICDGQTINLLAHYNGGSVKWSTGETTDQISVTTAGDYTATVTSIAGCQADTSITIAFLPNPVFSVNDTSICTYKKQAVTLTAPSGFSQYAWNGTPGGQTYQVTQPGTVSLTVTDANGCQATQQIKVVDQCPNIYIPNTFTPNGDGINDTWVIEGLDNDPTVLVRIFNRYGIQLYESKGYGTPWNGEYNRKKLPSGVYYYLVTAKNGSQKFSGSLTIIY